MLSRVIVVEVHCNRTINYAFVTNIFIQTGHNLMSNNGNDARPE